MQHIGDYKSQPDLVIISARGWRQEDPSLYPPVGYLGLDCFFRVSAPHGNIATVLWGTGAYIERQ